MSEEENAEAINAAMEELCSRLLHDERFDREAFASESEANREALSVIDFIIALEEENENIRVNE